MTNQHAGCGCARRQANLELSKLGLLPLAAPRTAREQLADLALLKIETDTPDKTGNDRLNLAPKCRRK